jgi:hypothetical protein
MQHGQHIDLPLGRNRIDDPIRQPGHGKSPRPRNLADTPKFGNCPNIIAVWRIRLTTRSAARSLSCAIQSRIASRSSRACGVRLTFKLEVAPYLLDRDHRRTIAALRQSALDLRSLPGRIAGVGLASLLGDLLGRDRGRLHARECITVCAF